jgi:hypothetical protein
MALQPSLAAGADRDPTMTTLEPPTLQPPTLQPTPSRRSWSTRLRAVDAVSERFDRLTGRVATVVADQAWDVLHVLGAHRWREGYETNVDRGWRQYRGSRCTVCDAPWEGW